MSNTKRINPITLAVAVVGIMAIVLVAAALLHDQDRAQTVDNDGDSARQTALASEYAPTLGGTGATVHIVEFLDPACETCAIFFPMVKQWMAQVPGQIRLSVRHVAFHEGSDYAVRVLEASRNQDLYWETLLRTQRQWTEHHKVLSDRIEPAIASVGLDMEQLAADMNSAEVTQRIERDSQDAILLQVSKTPDYYVNGRPLPSFGQQQLADLIREELRK